MKSLTIKFDMRIAVAAVCGLTLIALYFVLRPVPLLIKGQVISTKEEDYKLVRKPLIGAKIYFFTDKQALLLQGLLENWRLQTQSELEHDYSNLFKKFGVQKNGEFFIPAEKAEPIARANEIETLRKKIEANPKRIFPYSLHEDYLGSELSQKFFDEVLWAVSDSNGEFSLTLTKGRSYWVYCDSDAILTKNTYFSNLYLPDRIGHFRTGVWFFKFHANPGKLVLSASNTVW